jgi:DNA (cytosine-5)-methyltransferase 1
LSPAVAAARGQTLRLTGQIIDLVAPMQLLKTPTSQLAVNGGSQHPDKRKAGEHGPTLADEVEHLLPTPVCTDAFGARNSTAWRSPDAKKANSGNTLTDIIWKMTGQADEKLLPTPRATDGTKGGPNQKGSSGDLMLPSAVHQLTGDRTSLLSVDGKPCEEPPLPLPN